MQRHFSSLQPSVWCVAAGQTKLKSFATSSQNQKHKRLNSQIGGDGGGGGRS